MNQEALSSGFDFSAFARLPIIDGHTHVWADLDVDLLWQTMRTAGAQRCNVLSLPLLPAPLDGPGTYNRQALAFKRRSDGQAYAFGSLDYSAWTREGRLTAEELVAQAEAMWAEGFDGCKMWEGKPSVYVQLPDPLDGPLYAPFFEWMQAHAFPIILHMADASRFWDPARVGMDLWSYAGPGYPSFQDLIAETERILDRFPRLPLILAHFLFFWNDLPRAARFFDAHPSARFDLTPGVAGYADLSEDPAATREFFLRYADRLIYGTDTGAGPVVHAGAPFVAAQEIGQAWLVRAFLETDWDMPLPPGLGAVAPHLTGRRLHGIHLPTEALEKVYMRNFERIVGELPKVIRQIQ